MTPPSVSIFISESIEAFVRFFERSGCPLTDDQLKALATVETEAAA